MKKILLLANLACIVSNDAFAETWKCVEDGKLTITNMPCPPGAISTIVPAEPEGDISAESVDDELVRIKQKLTEIEAERQTREVDEATHEQAVQEEKEKEIERKIAAEKAAQQNSARRNAIAKKKKKKLEEEERALSRWIDSLRQ
jgi:hypothetical protein